MSEVISDQLSIVKSEGDPVSWEYVRFICTCDKL
jgi:hypothetical protein